MILRDCKWFFGDFRLIKIIICFPLDFTQRDRKHVVDSRRQSIGKQMRRTKFSTQFITWLETKERNSDFVDFQSLKGAFLGFLDFSSLLFEVQSPQKRYKLDCGLWI